MPARPRVALATCAAMPELHADDVPLLSALAAAGVDARPAVWDDAAVDWAGFDLVVVRSTWDYVGRRTQYLAWAASVPRLANPASVLAWNTDKRYLRELAADGVPIVPTTWVAPGEAYAPPAVEHVVKPAVSAGGRDTARYPAGADSTPHVQSLLDAGRDVMVQPYLSGIDVEGETAVMSFLGRYSHGARKAPVLVPGLDDPDDVEITGREPFAAEHAVATAAVASATAKLGLDAPLLYTRVDLVPGPDGPLLIELELTEPSLFFEQAPGSAERFADCVRELAGR